MARIPDSELERLKKEIPIERLVMGFGVELKRHGAELIGTCPFHDDKTPSLVVSPKTNLWHCLGVCSVGGSTIEILKYWKYWEILGREILGQPELTPFRLTNKEAEPSGTISMFIRGCKKDSFTAL